MSRHLNLSDRLHKRISHNDRNIGSGIFVGLLRQLLQVFFGQHVRGISQMNLEHGQSSVLLGQWNINSLLETSPDGGVENPWDVGRAEHENTFSVIADALHLHQELGLDAASAFALVLGTRRTQ